MPRNIYDTEKKTCDRCGFDHKKSSLRKQKGLYLGHDCFDNIDRIPNLRLRWQSPRDDSNTTTVPPDATPEVYTFSSVSGINLLSQTHELSERRDGRHKSIFMKVKSDGGNISISADPQVTPGTLIGDLLTLRGSSDIDSITLVDGAGLILAGNMGGAGGRPFTLEEGDAISFVYTDMTIGIPSGWGSMAWGDDPWGGGGTVVPMWVETSRFKGGI